MHDDDYYWVSHHEAASKFFVQKIFRLEIHHAGAGLDSILTLKALIVGHHFTISAFQGIQHLAIDSPVNGSFD